MSRRHAQHELDHEGEPAPDADPRDALIADMRARLDRLESAGPKAPPDGMEALSAADLAGMLRTAGNPQAFLQTLGQQEHELSQRGIRALERFDAGDGEAEAEALDFLRSMHGSTIVVNRDPATSIAYHHADGKIIAKAIDLDARREALRPQLNRPEGE